MNADSPNNPVLAIIGDPHGGDLEATARYRTPPANLEAEQALLGAILVNNDAASRVTDFLTPAHFMEPGHQRIFAAALKLIERGQIANPVTLKYFFDQDEALAEVGGAQYLARLAGAAVTVINAEHYGRAIFDSVLCFALSTGFGSNVSIWLGPPSMKSMITAFALGACIGFLGDNGPAASLANRSVIATAPRDEPSP